jgi:hypothetical protein
MGGGEIDRQARAAALPLDEEIDSILARLGDIENLRAGSDLRPERFDARVEESPLQSSAHRPGAT